MKIIKQGEDDAETEETKDTESSDSLSEDSAGASRGVYDTPEGTGNVTGDQ
jgi:hypothetical protein